MPLVTLTARAGKSGAFKSAILDGVHRAPIASGVPVSRSDFVRAESRP